MFHGSDWSCQEGSGYPSQEEPRCSCWEVTGFFLPKFTLIRRLSHPQLLSFMQTIFLWTGFPNITLTAGWPSPVLSENLMQHRYCALKEKTLFLWSLNIKTLLVCVVRVDVAPRCYTDQNQLVKYVYRFSDLHLHLSVYLGDTQHNWCWSRLHLFCITVKQTMEEPWVESSKV